MSSLQTVILDTCYIGPELGAVARGRPPRCADGEARQAVDGAAQEGWQRPQ
ncbi:hypothetical protein [Streptomyces sp. NPDC001717]|uniref:hypothetical protein n=1 Tax=Streptomyces sp. NPDC001717 TaxID=3364604 RepID=UPI0036C37411